MSLMDLLLAEPSAQDRYAQALQMTAGPSGPQGPGGVDPVNRLAHGIFGNDQVDVLQADDPRLRTRFGLTLAKPAMRSLADVLQQLGYHGDAGGGYRTAAQQAGMNPALAAPVGQSYHQEGLAIDAAAALQNNPQFARLMQAAGWNRFSPGGEPWHWSFGVTG